MRDLSQREVTHEAIEHIQPAQVERCFAWLGNIRRLVVRYERHALNYLGFIHLGCVLILLRQAV